MRSDLECFLKPFAGIQRWRRLFLSLSVALSIVSLLLGVQSFRISEGIVELFEEDVNLGRLQRLRREIFPDKPGDYEKALSLGAPGSVSRVRACPGAKPKSTSKGRLFNGNKLKIHQTHLCRREKPWNTGRMFTYDRGRTRERHLVQRARPVRHGDQQLPLCGALRGASVFKAARQRHGPVGLLLLGRGPALGRLGGWF